MLESAGGIFVDRSVLDLQYCALIENNANGNRGSVYSTQRDPANSISVIFNCTFSGTTAIIGPTGGSGGALSVNSAAAIHPLSGPDSDGDGMANDFEMFYGVTRMLITTGTE